MVLFNFQCNRRERVSDYLNIDPNNPTFRLANSNREQVYVSGHMFSSVFFLLKQACIFNTALAMGELPTEWELERMSAIYQNGSRRKGHSHGRLVTTS